MAIRPSKQLGSKDGAGREKIIIAFAVIETADGIIFPSKSGSEELNSLSREY
jgi:hypothetical protein